MTELDRNGRRRHWEGVYERKGPTEVTWHQDTPDSSLQLIEHTELGHEAALIDVGGGASLLVDHLLEAGLTDISVLDISDGALDHARARLGSRAADVRWIRGDVLDVDLHGPYDIWHDRAVFHFLIDASERATYVGRLRSVLRPDGHVILATFALDGPETCSGLPVVRYSPETLLDELGDGFDLAETWDEDHETPWGGTQRFVFCRFRRVA